MNPNLLDFALGYSIQTVFLFAALWIMIKLQKLNYHVLGLLGSAALACALDYIPYVGIEISVAVLLFCIMKVIGARTFTDAIFTTGISYALTFCFNLFVIGVLLGDLRLSARVRARTAEPEAAAATTAVATNTSSPATSAPATGKNPPALSAVARSQDKGASNPPPSVAVTNLANAGTLAADVAAHFTIKGISKGAIQTIAMIGNGTRTYDVVAGDSFQMQTAAGKANARCESVDENKVVLSVEGVKVTVTPRKQP